MGNREKLLAGAQQCLFELGYTRTTARDITTAAGTSLAAIGYHFGTVEVLLNAALDRAVEEWGELLRRDLDDLPADASARERFERVWARVIDSVTDNRALWVAQYEMLVRAEHAADLRGPLVDTLTEARYGLAETVHGVARTSEPRTAWLLGSLTQSLLLGMVVQWLFDPERALSGPDLVEALQLLTADLDAGG